MPDNSQLPEVSDILAQPVGARFVRADLHIHSFGASHDVRDTTMMPTNIVQTALAEKLSVIALADHNEITNVEAAVTTARDKALLVIPAVELSTPQGHLLCYLPTVSKLKQFHGRLTFAGRDTPHSRCQQSIIECLRVVEEFGGFGILAHVDVESGFEVENPGASPHKFDVIGHKALLGIELKHASSEIFYNPADKNADRRRMGEQRIKSLHLGEKQHLARILGSDAHTLHALGRNAQNQKRVTRFKMDMPTFEALRIALEDADARVRIEDLIPQSVPQIVGMKCVGGFLNEQIFHFSPNLNCIIGGRGTGKSTAFESMRCLAGGESESNVVDSEVWPEELHLFWKDQAEQTFTLYRPKDGYLRTNDEWDSDLPQIGIDCFGQGDAARISVQAQSNPLALLNYLDRFIELEEPLGQEEKIREELLTLQGKIETAERKVQLIPQFERMLKTVQQQLAALQKPEVKELIDLQRDLSSERTIQDAILKHVQKAKAEADTTELKSCIDQVKSASSANHLTLGSAEFKSIVKEATTLESIIKIAETDINAGLVAFEKAVKTQLANWRAKEIEAQKKIDAKRRELEALNIAFDMSYIAKLTKEEASHNQSVQNLKTWKPHLDSLIKQRRGTLEERWKARDRIASLREVFGKKASATLKEALSDLQVSLKYTKSAYSPEAAEHIIATMAWRTNQQPRAKWLVETLTIPKLVEAINKKDLTPILAIQTPEGVPVFRNDEATQILEKLGDPTSKFRLEQVALFDLPRLQITKRIVKPEGDKFIHRDFSKLSLGQQQSVLLALMLSSTSNRPLIIDQPEDNLDGEFIYHTLVPVLRMAKEKRQVIIVTHNPNVAVLGDAELLIVMKADNDWGRIVARGSIDNSETRNLACSILEGAREAFLRRAKMYGIRVVP